MCDDGCCKGIPNDNVPLFVTHLILTLLATTGWILCAAIIHEDWATHLQAWVVFVLGLTVAQTLYGIWASIVDARGGVFSRAETASRAGSSVGVLEMPRARPSAARFARRGARGLASSVGRRTSESPAARPSAAAAPRRTPGTVRAAARAGVVRRTSESPRTPPPRGRRDPPRHRRGTRRSTSGRRRRFSSRTASSSRSTSRRPSRARCTAAERKSRVFMVCYVLRGRHHHSNAAKISSNGARTAEIDTAAGV